MPNPFVLYGASVGDISEGPDPVTGERAHKLGVFTSLMVPIEVLLDADAFAATMEAFRLTLLEDPSVVKAKGAL
tara:strand:+ start:4821 stop:5042 length:222 start_codon:yes stop_codon:yes gene_type:complete